VAVGRHKLKLQVGNMSTQSHLFNRLPLLIGVLQLLVCVAQSVHDGRA
jgi:hypothetical protein